MKETKMKEIPDLKSILKSGKITNEIDLERALILDRKLRLLLKEHPELIESRIELRLIIKSYETAHWSEASEISESRIKESDTAEFIAYQERIFLEKRKIIIKENLNKLKITQQQLGKLLGHGKTYISELMNGISPFTMRDLIILHKLFQISLDDLIPTIISQKDRVKIKNSISEINNPALKFEKDDLISV